MPKLRNTRVIPLRDNLAPGAYQSRLQLVSGRPTGPNGNPADDWQERTQRAHGTPKGQTKKRGAGYDDPSGFAQRDAAWPGLQGKNGTWIGGNAFVGSNDHRTDKGPNDYHNRHMSFEENPYGMGPTTFDSSSVVDIRSARNYARGGAVNTIPSIDEEDDGDTHSIELGDGSVIINLEPSSAFNIDGEPAEDEDEDNDFRANLALKINDMDLSAISAQILEGIRQDEESRREVLETRRRGIKLLGYVIEEPRGDTGTSSAPLEGMSTVRHSLLSEACVNFQAGARAELLPSEGPVKVRNDTPIGAPAAPPGQPPQGLGSQPLDELASALESDMNHYVTVTLSHYVPDTDRMLFAVGFGGDGFKKLYHCPLKRRPTSISVDPEDLIVSNMATDLENCGRVTHRIRMRKSILRRMQIIGAYRDVKIQMAAVADQPDAVKQEIADVMGAKAEPMRPQDVEYTLYEAYVELDLDEFAPQQFKGEGLPLPYRVTIEKDSRQILEITRDWKEEDDLCERRQTFVQYPFIPALGFYSLGFLHLLGNTTLALTAATREMLDAGMFSNFPGFIYAKQVGRQLTNQFRCPPGGGIAIELPSGMAINQVVMPLPYKEVGPAFPAFIQHVEQNGRQLAMVSNSPVAEGKQDAPVGTTLALIEQQTKVIGAAFKRLHIAQAREFKILKDLLREDPEALWRHNQTPARQWTKKQVIAALSKYELVPVADPNNPTSLHRMAKAAMLKTLQSANPNIYDPIAVDRRILTMANIDAEGLFKGPQPNQPDPVMLMLQARQQLATLQLQIKDKDLQVKGLIAAMQQQGKAADRSSQERIEVLKAQIVQDQQSSQQVIDRLKMNADMIQHVHGLMADEHKRIQDGQLHAQKMDQQDDLHQQRMEHKEATHRQGLISKQQPGSMKSPFGQNDNQQEGPAP